MGKVDLGAQRKAAEKQGLLGSSDYLKIKEGANKIRILSGFLPHPGEYQGRKTFKWLCYVIDRGDGEIKPYFMPPTIYKLIESLQESEEYAFDEVPMPYDITVNAKGAGTIDVEYSVLPARQSTPLTATELADYEQKRPLEELQAALRSRGTAEQPERLDPDEIPT